MIQKSTINFYKLVFALLIICSCSRMVIQYPQELANQFQKIYENGELKYSIANYGIVPYGKIISGEIVLPTFFQDCVYEDIPEIPSQKKVIMVERNDCTFTQKSINVEKQGGKMAIIMDNVVENIGRIVLADDGRGGQVSIPTVMISKQDGNKILEYLKRKTKVVISVSFQTIKLDRSNLQLWIDLNDRKNIVFLRNFYPYFRQIKEYTDLQVFYPTRICNSCNESNCFYNNTYCKTPSDWGDIQIENAGKILILEQLRQEFIFQQYPQLWWKYVFMYDQECDSLVLAEQCSTQSMKKLGIDADKIKKMVKESFGQEDNSILRKARQLKYNNSLIYYPSIIVNSQVYRGNLQAFQVYDLICESLQNQPSECNGIKSTSSGNIYKWILIGVATFILFTIFVVVCYRRVLRRKTSTTINKRVNEIVNQYITMYENDKFNADVQLKDKKKTEN